MTRTAESSDHRVTIIVPTYRDWARMALCLQSLAAQTYPASLVEILVVNNEPSDPPPHDLCAPANCRILDEPKKGSYAARNTALKEATGDIVLFTDSDCIAEPTWCAEAVRHLSEQSEFARFGGQIEIFTDCSRLTVADVYESIYAFEIEKYVSRGWAPTANMGAWRSVFDVVGPFSDQYYSGSDGAWGIRAMALGFPVGFCESAKVWHPARSSQEIIQKRRRISGAQLKRQINQNGRSRVAAAFLFRFMRRILPPIPPIFKLVRQRDVPPLLRWKTYFLIYFMRISVELEKLCVLFFSKEPERR